MEEARTAHFAGQPQYDECKSKAEDVQETMRNAMEWLARVKERKQLVNTVSWWLEEHEMSLETEMELREEPEKQFVGPLKLEDCIEFRRCPLTSELSR